MSTNKVWQKLIRDLLMAPIVSPRGFKTKELIGYQTKIEMNEPFVTVPQRKIGEKFRYAEAAWILSGDNKVSTIKPYSKIIEKFSDDGIRFFGAYGPKVVDQLSYVITNLMEDQVTRQAVINIWREKPQKSKDVPCTCSLQFFIRDTKIHCIATMRSSDAWLGWVYDVFNFSCIANYIRIQLHDQYGFTLQLGSLTVNAGSQHLYEQHWHDSESCLRYKGAGATRMLGGFKNGEEFIEYLWTKANG